MVDEHCLQDKVVTALKPVCPQALQCQYGNYKSPPQSWRHLDFGIAHTEGWAGSWFADHGVDSRERAGQSRVRPNPLHVLRHTAVTNVYRASRDLFLAQRFARHVSPLTTIIYTHPSDEELLNGVRALDCQRFPTRK